MPQPTLPGIQEAIEALPDGIGGEVLLPRGYYELTQGIIVPPEKYGVSLRGEGPATVIRPAPGFVNAFDLITVNSSEFRLSNLWIDGLAQEIGDKVCLRFRRTTGNVSGCSLENVLIQRSPSTGLALQSAHGFIAVSSQFVHNEGLGVSVRTLPGNEGATDVRFVGCSSAGNKAFGVDITTARARP